MSVDSLLGNIATADKLKSVDAIKQSVAAGTIPGFIGWGMINKLVQDAEQAKAFAGGAPNSTVVQQVDQKAEALTHPQQMAYSERPPIPTQVPPQNPMPPREMVAGIDAAQSNLPTQNMASGGIVAFAGGDLVDDEYDPFEDEDNEEYYADMEHQSRLAQMLAQSEAESDALTEDILDNPEAYAGVSTGIKNAGTGIKYKEPIPAGGSKGFVDKIQHLESRGRDYDEKGNILTSPKGAMGSMQTMAGTLRDPGFGVKPAQDNSVAEMKRVGIDYANAMLRRYGNEQDAAMAYNWGPGNVDKWIAGNRQGFVPNETRQYATRIASMAEGGIVGLATGGDVKSYDGTGPDKSQVTDDSLKDNEYLQRSRGVTEGVKNLGSNLYNALTTPKNYDIYDMYQRNIGKPFARGVSNFVNEPLESQAARFRSYSMTPNQTPTVGYNTPLGSDTPVPTTGMPDETEKERERNRFASFAAQNKPFTQQVNQFVDQQNREDAEKAKAKTSGSNTEPEISPQDKAEQTLFQQMQEAIKKRTADLENEKSIDNYLAALQGFLGMMGGTSPYAMVNIGQGASSGINTLLGARKQTGLAERALGRDQMSLLTAQNALNRQAQDKTLKERALQNSEKRTALDEEIRKANAFETARKDALKEALTDTERMELSRLERQMTKEALKSNDLTRYNNLQAKIKAAEIAARKQVYGSTTRPGVIKLD